MERTVALSFKIIRGNEGTNSRQASRGHASLQAVLSEERPQPKDEGKRAVLLAEFGEACSAWRLLTEVRFKLLALIPPVSALALTGIVSAKGPLEGTGRSVRLAAAVFGLLITTALYIYERRNSELYSYLVNRAEQMECELGVERAVFRGRPRPSRSLMSHRVALHLIYGLVLAAWILAAIAVLVGNVPVASSSS
jgi:hypothetical protein